MKARRASFEVFITWGFLLGAMIFSSLPSTCVMEDEALDPDFLKQKMKEHGMGPENSHVFTPPELTDEERGSQHMPKHLRCAACVAVSYQFGEQYKKAMKSVKAKKELSLMSKIEVVDTVCEKRLTEYGVKEHEGKKVLSGPGLAAAQIPGVTEGGGKWIARLRTLCLQIDEQFEEEGIYEMYKRMGSSKLAIGLCQHHCPSIERVVSFMSSDYRPKTVPKREEL